MSTETSVQHCGSCGHACADGEACLAGQCGGPFGDGCGDQLATGVRIREIAVYQAGKIPIMKDGAALARNERPADVIQGKAARVRVFIDLDSGFAARAVSARLLLDNDGVHSNHFSKLTLSQPSIESSFATTFNFDVDPQDIAKNTRYAVEIVECGGVPNGALARPRFPDGDKLDLEARATGILKLRFIPFVTNGRVASTDQARLDAYRDYVAKMYPVTGVEYSVGEPLAISNPITRKVGWGDALDQLSARHEADAAPNDLYYYGLFEPTAKLADFCGDGCTAGIGYQVDDPTEDARDQRVCFGLSYGDDGAQLSSSSAETLAHEVGHNHGRGHAPCGNPDQLDPDYPYAEAALGWWGFTPPDKLFDPAKSTDIMGYCDQQWVSDYTYRALTARVAQINQAPLQKLSARSSPQHFRFLLLDEDGARWGLDRAAPRYPTGTAESAEVLDATDQVIASVTVYRTHTDQREGAVLLVPDPAPGWYAIRVHGADPLPFR